MPKPYHLDRREATATAAPDPAEQAAEARERGDLVDFNIFTAAMELGTWRGDPVVNMVGSSTVGDLKKDSMLESALRDMEKAPPGLVIWLNHDYTLPDSLFGGLVKSPTMTWDGAGIADLHLTCDVELDNPKAAAVYKYVQKGRRLGCSVGCRVDTARIDEELYEKSGEIALLIERVTPVEWSVVGVPCNQRSWVENAIKGYVSRRLATGKADPREGAVLKSLYPKEFKALAAQGLAGNESFLASVDTLLAKRVPGGKRLYWDPASTDFIINHKGILTPIGRETVPTLLTNSAAFFADSEPEEPDDDDDEPANLITLAPGPDDTVQELEPLDPEMDSEEHPEGERNQPLPAGTHDLTVLVAEPASSLLLNGVAPSTLTAGLVVTKAPTAAAKSRAAKYGIALKGSGNKPGKWKSVPDSQWGDPVNYKYPMPDAARARNALSRWGDASNRSQYSKSEQATIGARIKRRAKALGVKVAGSAKSLSAYQEPIVKTKTKPVWTYTWKALPALDAESAVLPGAHRVYLEMAEKDGVDLLPPEVVEAERTAYEAERAALAPDQVANYKAPDETEALPFLTERRKSLLAAQKKLRKATRQAEIKGILSGETPTDAPAPDPVREAKLIAFRTLAVDLGVTFNKDATKAKVPSVRDPRRVAAKVALRQAYGAVKTKTGATISEKNMAQLQLAHDALALITEGALCTKVGNDAAATAAMQANIIAGADAATLDTRTFLTDISTAIKKALSDENTSVTAKLDATRAELARLEETARKLRDMPLPRPTQTSARTVPGDPATTATYADMVAAGQSDPTPALPSDILSGTLLTTVKRSGYDMRVRRWPEGYAKGKRPALSTRAMPYMLMRDIQAYQDGGEADVPELD